MHFRLFRRNFAEIFDATSCARAFSRSFSSPPSPLSISFFLFPPCSFSVVYFSRYLFLSLFLSPPFSLNLPSFSVVVYFSFSLTNLSFSLPFLHTSSRLLILLAYSLSLSLFLSLYFSLSLSFSVFFSLSVSTSAPCSQDVSRTSSMIRRDWLHVRLRACRETQRRVLRTQQCDIVTVLMPDPRETFDFRPFITRSLSFSW